VIEGVMMRVPWGYTVAVRRPDGGIQVLRKRYISLADRFRFLKLPVVRGAVVLFETLYLGLRAIEYSADVAVDGDEKSEKGFGQTVFLIGTLLLAFGLGIALFFYLPLVVAGLLPTDSGLLFNLVDGLVRLVLIVGYLWGIGRWSEMRRILQYHGAEHKSIGAFEAGEELELENVRRHSTLHPRCGTSFLFMVVIVSLAVFIFLGRPDSFLDRVVRFLAVPVIAGLSYEAIRLSERMAGGRLGRLVYAPGLALQRFTTREPSEDQLEVAIRALETALEMERT